ncbi:ABC transporter ATP-binding protein [Flavobacterium foetidum]|uniref:ABC transporter ATP-binding protein n=1 Tax=Flavobacterium foetidum TaxID=2026681 RepID=UPI001074FC0D|nr:ABC transporter ATP-binding protein [Flavobacterium foetidum]KAF2513551.1 ATP-binding cassette domain-containing protein [Flavobacterium foetidum]
MKDIILKAENISKQYRLGQVGTGTLSHDLNRWWYKIRGKENPYLKIGDTNDRSTKGTSDYVWALQDINFEVERGEVLGIIGKNGAGKSTLLKILSKVTAPTTGSIKSRGRIASLLEVGTGFNGEMTGRENIFLNGAILGMTKKEIASKLDEIIEFSGCERYIDTPVKRYSSGMTVRLAFAVAAFLEPEILVVDEVLAVGDAEFQKKAIGKMQDISRGEGRTVLFVSHNMAAVKSLCTRGIVMEFGKIIFEGSIDDSINYYSEIFSKTFKEDPIHKDYANKIEFRFSNFEVNDKLIHSGATLFLGQKIKLKLQFLIKDNLDDLSIAFDVINKSGELVSHLTNEDDGFYIYKLVKGDFLNIEIETAELLFIPGFYCINLWVGIAQRQALYDIKNFFSFSLEQSNYSKRTKALPQHAKMYLHSNWKIPDIAKND